MPSFDIVSELDEQEVDNAVNQAKKEILTRYDFKGSKSEINLDKEGIGLVSDDELKMKALLTVVQTKIGKRGISLNAFETGKTEQSGSLVKCFLKMIKGIEKDKAKELVKKIKDTKMKIQASIDGDKVRITGKKRDDLQEAMAMIKGLNYSIPLQFTNFRD
jgi:cyclic-di-GMP-binding protein